tara:strand:- start:165 stop:551 length:387 start_codon:yes stop_codon:yes gene_type:complete
MAMIAGENVDIDFTNPEIYTDEYAEENADTEEFKFIKETPVYKDVRESLSLGMSFENALNYAAHSLLDPIYSGIAEGGFNVIEYEDGTQNISNETIERLSKGYQDEIAGILATGGGPQEEYLKEMGFL